MKCGDRANQISFLREGSGTCACCCQTRERIVRMALGRLTFGICLICLAKANKRITDYLKKGD